MKYMLFCVFCFLMSGLIYIAMPTGEREYTKPVVEEVSYTPPQADLVSSTFVFDDPKDAERHRQVD